MSKVIFLDIDGVLNSNFQNNSQQTEISDGTLIDVEKIKPHQVAPDQTTGLTPANIEQAPKILSGSSDAITHPAGSLGHYKYVVICSSYQGIWLLSKHKDRETWELQGGHIAAGENPVDAARRELYEESGARKADLYHICDYRGSDSAASDNGAVYFGLIHELDELPESEMELTKLFDELPRNLTYPCLL